MLITPGVRELLVKKFGMLETATDAEARTLLATKMVSGELTNADLDAAVKAPAEATKNAAMQSLETKVGQMVAEQVGTAVNRLEGLFKTFAQSQAETKAAHVETKAAVVEPTTKLVTSNEIKSLISSGFNGAQTGVNHGWDLDDDTTLVVKSHVDRFDDTKTSALWAKGANRGQPIEYGGRSFDVPTPRRKALAAAWFKFQVMPEDMTPQDRALVLHAIHKEKFIDDASTETRLLKSHEKQQLTEMVKHGIHKALIADNTSGGNYATPEFFDTDLIILPLLGGEIAPYVTMQDVARGTSAQGFRIGNPTFAASNTEGSAYSVFTTTSFISNLDTTFYRAAGAMEIGRNFLQDATPGLADEILRGYSRAAAVWLDEQILNGDGTTEPEGILNASGIGSVSSTNNGGARTVADAINLMFAVGKAYKQQYDKSGIRFAMTETTYKRFRSVATGVTGDTRLVFGENFGAYELLGVPVSIEESGLTNAKIVYAQFKGYKLYRRQGLQFFREESGKTLRLANTILIGGDMRFGGSLRRGGYAAAMTDAAT